MTKITQERAKELLDYNPDTGVFIWKERKSKTFNTKYAGKEAGRGSANSENRISIEKKDYSASKLAWLIIYGGWVDENIVYLDGNFKNCSINNLCKPKQTTSELTQDILKEHLRYDPETGFMYWNNRSPSSFPNRTIYTQWSSKIAGTQAGNVNPDGYIKIKVLGKTYQAHRLVWLYVTGSWPDNQIDHINHIRSDNRFENLRDIQSCENTRNTSLYKNNSTGVHGVRFNSLRRKWISDIGFNNRRIRLGSYETLLDAVAARKAAEVKYGFHENHGQ